MERHHWKKLALLGMTSGLMLSNSLSAKEESSSKTSEKADVKKSDVKKYDPNDGNMNYHMMTEDELLLELNDKGAKMYRELSPEGKALALSVASVMCNASNPCKNLNACQTDEHECAGKGECKGKGKCAFSDKNLAVKVVYDKIMAQKRANANRPTK